MYLLTGLATNGLSVAELLIHILDQANISRVIGTLLVTQLQISI